MSILTVNTGSMFSGKSTMLIQQGEKHLKAGQKVVFIKPSIDDRYSKSEIVTHDGKSVNCINAEIGMDITKLIEGSEVDVVLIDEVQFFSKRICNSIWKLLSMGIQVYASGLDMTYLTDGFETVAELMCVADHVNKIKGVCECCGAEAVITGKRSFFEGKDTGDIVDIGEKDKYFPICRKCYFKKLRGE